MASSEFYVKIKQKDGTTGVLLLKAKDLSSFEVWCQNKKAFLLKIVPKKFYRTCLYHKPYTSLERLLTYSHLATALQGGFSLTDALTFCGATPKAQLFLWIVEKALTSGEPLESIMARYPDFFIEPAYSVISAGLSTGTLAISFETLAFFHTQNLAFNEKMKKALQYPLFVLTIICGVFGLLSFYVIPMVDSLAATPDYNASSLPLFYLFSGVFLSITGSLIGLWILSKGRSFLARYAQDILKYIPFIGPLMICQAWWIRLHVFELLVRNHYHPLRALEHINGQPLEPYIHKDFSKVFEKISRGKTFSQALESFKSLPTPARHLLSLGAQTGSFHEPLKGACHLLQTLVDHHSHRLTLWLEPLSLCVMGTLMIVLSVFGPLYHNLTEIGL